MNIFLDARFYNRSGIGRYIGGLYKCMLGGETAIRVTAAGDINLMSGDFLSGQDLTPYNASIYSLGELIKGSLLVNRFRQTVDVFHFPNYNTPWMLPGNSVVTIHDLTQFLFPEFFGRIKRAAATLVLKHALKSAGRIVVVSNATAKDIGNYYPEFMDKVRVIHNGISEGFMPLDKNEIILFKRAKCVDDYILYVGNRKPHKNLRRLLDAFFLIRKRNVNLKLVIIGERFSEVDEVDVWRRDAGLNNDAVREITEVSDAELRKYYCGAKMLVQPSLYEGFGFTPLEAMACGTPAVVSKVSSLTEVCGDAAMYFNPYSVPDMTEKINMVLETECLGRALAEKGSNHATLFTWGRCAKEMLKVFEEVATK